MKNKETEQTVKIPLRILEKPVGENSDYLLRFFVQFFGKEYARSIIEFITKGGEENINMANAIIEQKLKEKYPSLANDSSDDIKRKLIGLYYRANNVVNKQRKTSFPGMTYELGMVNSATIPNTNLAEIFETISSTEKNVERYKFEILRQLFIILILVEKEKASDTLQNTEDLNRLDNLFKDKLYEKKAELTKEKIFSVHDNITNLCLGTFKSLAQAQMFIAEINGNDQLHIKKHKWRMRQIIEVGTVLTNMRTKSDFSTVAKAVANAQLAPTKIKSIDMNQATLHDQGGFMFVASDIDKSNILRNLIIDKINQKYLQAVIIDRSRIKNTVMKTGRGQSNQLEFSRDMVNLDNERKPIEIMNIDQTSYINYRFELSQSHKLYSRRKVNNSADLFFPEKVYEYNHEKVEEKRRKKEEKIRKQLLNNRRVKI